MKKVTDLRKAFWEAHPELKSEFRVGKRHRAYTFETMSAFMVFINKMYIEGRISENLLLRATL